MRVASLALLVLVVGCASPLAAGEALSVSLHHQCAVAHARRQPQGAVMKSLKVFFPLALLTLSLAPAAHAQLFGSGIVFNPTQSGHAIEQISQGEQQLQKWGTE